MKIVADENIPFIKDYFGGYGELLLKPGRSITHADVHDADMLLVRSITHVDAKLLANTPVKFVGSVTAGADHLDTKWLEQAGIVWSVASGFNAPPVADYVVSVIAALQRKKLLKQNNIKAAVIGVGNVGRLVVERMKLLNFDITLCDPLRAQEEADFVSTPFNELSDLDLISLHVPLVKSGQHPTYHFIDKDFLQRQKPGCILLNASRGSVINSADLLQYGTHMHWCFDVWEREPKIDKNVLQQSLIATPHIAGYSVQSKIRGIDMIYRIVCDNQMLEPKPINPIVMPKQRLGFAGEQHDWQDIILGVFNPVVITEMMRSILLPDENYAHLFDEMRNQFNYRYEFGYTNIIDEICSDQDRVILKGLGCRVD